MWFSPATWWMPSMTSYRGFWIAVLMGKIALATPSFSRMSGMNMYSCSFTAIPLLWNWSVSHKDTGCQPMHTTGFSTLGWEQWEASSSQSDSDSEEDDSMLSLNLKEIDIPMQAQYNERHANSCIPDHLHVGQELVVWKSTHFGGRPFQHAWWDLWSFQCGTKARSIPYICILSLACVRCQQSMMGIATGI